MIYVWMTAIFLALIVGYFFGKSRVEGKRKDDEEGKEELGVKELIKKIKDEGIRTTEEEVAKLKAEAEEEIKKKRKKVEEEIKKKYEEMERKLASERERFEQSLKIAGRDFLLKLREDLEEHLLKRSVAKEVEGVLTDSDFLKKAVLTMIAEFSKRKGEVTDIELLLPKEKAKEMKGYFIEKIEKEIGEKAEKKPKVEIGILDGKVGFKVGPKGENYQLDITMEALTDSFVSFLRPDFRRYFLGEDEKPEEEKRGKKKEDKGAKKGGNKEGTEKER